MVSLYKEISNATSHIRIHRSRFWSDSTIVLHWIRTFPHLLKTFVANRVSEIQAITKPDDWFHISTTDNPADLISRGQLPSQFILSNIWLNGPHWLIEDEKTWPISELTHIDIPEKRNLISLPVNQETNSIILRFSSIQRLNRVVAYLLRFFNNCKNSKDKFTGQLTQKEVENAHLRIIKLVQAEAFALDIRYLNQGKSIDKNSKLLCLNPFMDNQQILRVGGRLKYSPISYSQKHPILLPRIHHVTNLILRHEHLRQWHAGLQATLNAVRQRY